jgi:hypothetical protein
MTSDIPTNKPSPKMIPSLLKSAGIPIALVKNGFPVTQVVAPDRNAHPLIIGTIER